MAGHDKKRKADQLAEVFGGPGQPKQSKLDFKVLSKEEKAAQMTIESIDHKANKMH